MSSVRALAPAMIGRQAQLGELEEYLEQTRGGAGRLLFIVGDAGVGKTRLLREFAGRAQAGGVMLLEGHCYDEQPAPPYGPFVDALRALVRQRGPNSITQAAGAWASSLAPLLPEIEAREPSAHLTAEPQSENRRVFDAIARVFRASAARGLVLILEDLHWSDQSSQELLAYLARAVERDPILILATYRGDELHRRHPLTHLVAQLTRERRYHEVRLPRLAHAELARMLEATLEQVLPGAFVDALYERTDGNPFFVEEILKALIENGRLDALIEDARRGHHSAQLDIPHSLKESILSRTVDLDAMVTEVLRYAAVIGRRFDFDLLLRLTGLVEAELLRSVALLLGRQLVVEERGVEDRYSFRHALTREAIYDDILGRERRIKHRAVLHALEEFYSDDRDAVADQLAYHSLQAKELALAGRYARLAGDHALHMHAYREARAHYETALELLETDDPRERAALTEQLATAALPLQDNNLILRYLREAHQLYMQIGDRHKVAEIDRWIGVVAQWAGDIEAAFTYTRAAVDILEAEPPGHELATAYSMLSRLYMLTDHPQESIIWAEKAQPLAEAFADEELSANLLNNIGYSLIWLADTQRGISLLERAVNWAKRLSTAAWFTRMRAYQNLSVCLSHLGEFARAAGIAREGIEQADEAGYMPTGEWLFLSYAELFLGHWDTASELIDRALSNSAVVEGTALKAELLRRRGQLEEARQLLELGLPAINTASTILARRILWNALARTHLSLGDIDQAVAGMDRAIADWRTTGPLLGTEDLLNYGVEVYLAAGREENARELLDALATIAGRAATPLSLAHYDDARGLFAAHEGRHAEAAEHFRQAAARWQAMEAPFEEAVARRRLAESLLLAGDAAAREDARRELGMARAVFERLGAPLELAAADALAEKYGLAAQGAKVPTRKGELTARERQVIALIAQGHSNRQIAEALTISEKTAEIHVGNILGKLGFSSRAQAAAYAVEHGIAAAANTPSS